MKIRLQDVVRTGILAALAVALQAMTHEAAGSNPVSPTI